MRYALLLAAVVGCYSPSYPDCQVLCAQSGECPSGLSCHAGMCRTEGFTQTCGEILGDAGGGADGDPTKDTDGDRILDGDDNCRDVANFDQYNEDGDAAGDACDACPIVSSLDVPGADVDMDGDGIGTACDPFPDQGTEKLALFEGFNGTSTPMQAIPLGPTPWTIANGTASAMAGDLTSWATLLWAAPFDPTTRAYVVYTRVTLLNAVTVGNNQVHGAGPIGAGDPNGTGAACLIGTQNQEPGLYAATVMPPGDSSNGFSPAPLTPNAENVALVHSTNILQCSGLGTNVPGSPIATTQNTNMVGIHTHSAVATFEFIYAVDTPMP